MRRRAVACRCRKSRLLSLALRQGLLSMTPRAGKAQALARKAPTSLARAGGLSAATTTGMRGVAVTLIEAAGRRAGAAGLYFDAAIERCIDNGNHLVLSGNRAVHGLSGAHRGAGCVCTGPPRAGSPFRGFSGGKRWRLPAQ